MGTERNSDYYDNAYKISQHYSLDVNGYNSPWSRLYIVVKQFLNKDERILEIGCGSGQFAEILINEKYNYIHGIDFSPEAISMSKLRCKNEDKFSCNNVYMFDFSSINFDTIIALEIFEHIEMDIETIEKIPKGKKVIFSVPKSDAKGHVRFFNNEKEVINRYKSLFSNFNVTNIGHIFIVNSIK